MTTLRRRLALRLPYETERILNASLSMLRNDAQRRAWALPDVTVLDEVRHYRDRHKANGVKSPRPRLRKTISPPLAAELALKIDAGIQFAEIGKTADWLTKPIQLYYSCAQLSSAYCRAFFEWEKDNLGHGMMYNRQGASKIDDVLIALSSRGHFPRLAVTCFLLSGMPSIFSELITYSVDPTMHSGAGERLEHFGKTEIGEPVRKLTLNQIVEFDLEQRVSDVRLRHGFHKFGGLPTSAFLLDVISLFLASNFARYNVANWERIRAGKDNSYRLHFEEVFERYLSFTVDMLLALLENPTLKFDQGLHPGQLSPYSSARVVHTPGNR